MNLTEINIREKKFHDNLQSKKSGRFENIFYKAIYNITEDFFNYLIKTNVSLYIVSYLKYVYNASIMIIWDNLLDISSFSETN